LPWDYIRGIILASRKGASVAKKKASTEPTAMSVKMTVGFRDWLNELAEHERSTAVQVMEKAVVLYAKKVGFNKPAPKRTEGR
jgi:hypothetical protein